MEKKKLNIVLMVLLILLVIAGGISFAYFTTRINSNGEGSRVEVQTATKGDTTVTTTGTMEFTDTNIYPGHQNISSIKVTATGTKNIVYNLIWEGTNTLNTTLKYTIYKTTTNETPSITCTKKEEGTITKKLYEECTKSGFDNLGSIVTSGNIGTSTTTTKIELIADEEIQATAEGANVYYYVILEYPNNDESQNIDMNGRFSGVVKTELAAELKAGEYILADKIIDESRSTGQFTDVLTENTTGRIFRGKDDDGDTYFFAGAVDNNWVQFGTYANDIYYGYRNETSTAYKAYNSLTECQNASSYNINCKIGISSGTKMYWRIIRINGDGTIRMIYSGAVDGTLSDANTTGKMTLIDGVTYEFNSNDNDNAYVGYMYGQVGASSYADTHKNITSSYVKQHVDNWYNTNLNKEELKEYIDTDSGFCGDRKVVKGTILGRDYQGDGYGTQVTAYVPYSKVMDSSGWASTQTPTFKCSQSNDWYTTGSASKGNKALTHPVGLITMDEVIFAGGFGGKENSNYYLYTNQSYWTMSSSQVDPIANYADVFYVGSNGLIGDAVVNGTYGVRPVINLRADTKLAGDGTETNPYKVV